MLPRASTTQFIPEYCVLAASFEPNTAQSCGLRAYASELCNSSSHGYILGKKPVPVSQRTLCKPFMVQKGAGPVRCHHSPPLAPSSFECTSELSLPFWVEYDCARFSRQSDIGGCIDSIMRPCAPFCPRRVPS